MGPAVSECGRYQSTRVAGACDRNATTVSDHTRVLCWPRTQPSFERPHSRMRSRTLAVAFATTLIAALVPLSGCQAPKVIESVWPKAVSERSVPKPAGPPRWPLTGLAAPSLDAARLRVVSVKIENSTPARPQSGLDQADVVYETVTEGGITRFNALYQSRAPKVVGPVRSARVSDFYIVPQYHALFAHVGGESNVMKVFADRKKYSDMDQFFNPSPYWRSHDRSAPHNTYADVTRIRGEAVRKRKYAAMLEIKGLAFSLASSAATPTITQLTVPFAPDNKVVWRYDAKSGTYLRSINGKAHVDKTSRKQYRATNVVVLWTQVRGRSRRDAAGSSTVEIVLSGTGRASVFRNGQRYDGTWEAGLDAPPTFRAANGPAIKLAPGNTWFQVIANDQNIVMR